ncbi:class I SAM-dependent methyltransferase [Sphingomonas sp. BK235]|uniref:class I SAM-dependent methyltransferase n=1 Tax=Sphingomonas sp. BK235 TaxID=2512131 RepID=UPI0010502567|nr:class I SAM-dependent methyltransferase [Sphingomonas sp. BK235]TCP29372.1 methyltransferase family protein [Sphingomonas sp. BK235]
MIDWTAKTDDPLDAGMRRQLEAYLRGISKIVDRSLLSYFREAAAGRDVLHIGCCEHSAKYMSVDGWKHRAIAETARSLLGVDINAPAVEAMRQLGYDVVLADATGDTDIGKRFDCVIIGDVIEHVSDLEGLLRFADRHLTPDGILVISTPNPFFVRHVTRAWFSRPMIANFEHVSWVTESNIIELVRRTGMSLEQIVYPVGNSSSNRSIALLKRLSYRIAGTALFTTNVYVIKGSAAA